MFLGATNAFTGGTGTGNNPVSNEKDIEINKIARTLKDDDLGWIAVGDENIGEGSSREHAAMEPRHMGGRAFIAKSYARIFEANLKKQGLLPLTFNNKDDFEKIQEKDRISISGLDALTQGGALTVHIKHEDGSTDEISVEHSLNEQEIQWFYHGSALNYVGSQK
jgi:aconitate hydratase